VRAAKPRNTIASIMRWRSGVIVVSEVRGTAPEDEGTTQRSAEIGARHHRVSGLVQRSS